MSSLIRRLRRSARTRCSACWEWRPCRELVCDRDGAVQHWRRVAGRVGDTHDEVMASVAHVCRVEPDRSTHRREAGLQVQERRQPIGRLADVLAPSAVFVER